MPQVISDAAPWVILSIGAISLPVTLGLRIPESTRGVPLRLTLPTSALLVVTLAAAAPIGSIPLTVGMILLNLSWVSLVVRTWRRSGSETSMEG